MGTPRGPWLRGEPIDSLEDLTLAIKVRKARVFPRLKDRGLSCHAFLASSPQAVALGDFLGSYEAD